MLDRMGPNIASGPIPRDGFTTDAYEFLTRSRLHAMGFSDILGETGERPDEISNGIDHLDKLEHMGKSAKDLAYTVPSRGALDYQAMHGAQIATATRLTSDGAVTWKWQ